MFARLCRRTFLEALGNLGLGAVLGWFVQRPAADGEDRVWETVGDSKVREDHLNTSSVVLDLSSSLILVGEIKEVITHVDEPLAWGDSDSAGFRSKYRIFKDVAYLCDWFLLPGSGASVSSSSSQAHPPLCPVYCNWIQQGGIDVRGCIGKRVACLMDKNTGVYEIVNVMYGQQS